MLCNDLFVFFLSHTYNNEYANKGKCSIINWRQLNQLKILKLVSNLSLPLLDADEK